VDEGGWGGVGKNFALSGGEEGWGRCKRGYLADKGGVGGGGPKGRRGMGGGRR